MNTIQHPAAEVVMTIALHRSQLNHAVDAILRDTWVQDESHELGVDIGYEVVAQAIVNVLQSGIEDMFADWIGEDWLRNPEYGKRLQTEIKSLADNLQVSRVDRAA